MSIQFITDNSGKKTGVYIPIEQWNSLKSKFRDLEEEVLDIPDWHKTELDKRLKRFKTDPDNVLSADEVLNDIENEL
jgi:hypothetical protein